MQIKTANNFAHLYDNFQWEKCHTPDDEWEAKGFDKQGSVHEGGSGSAKTWDILQFIMLYCQRNKGLNKRILIFRQTYADCRDTVLDDFLKIMKLYGMYDSKCHYKSQPQKYILHGNTIRFTGLESMGSHGKRNDVIYGNEGMELNEEAFKQLNQRCNELFIIDYNPSCTVHWIYKSIIPRPDTKFIKTTQLHNPFLPVGQRKEILAYEPTSQNISNGTADEHMWNIYGLGRRGSVKGRILTKVKSIDSFPDVAYWYGLDFGYTSDPTALVRYAREGNDIFTELLIYEPIAEPDVLIETLDALGIEKDLPIICDSSDKYINENGVKEFVKEIQIAGYAAEKVSKTKTVMFWLGKLKRLTINIVTGHLSQKAHNECESYRMAEIAGIPINKPEDKNNHYVDAMRYGYMGEGEEIFFF